MILPLESMNRLSRFLYARFRAFAPLSCLFAPRADELALWPKWRWLSRMRREGRLVDPSVSIRGTGEFLERIELGEGVSIDQGVILWLGEECGILSNLKVGERSYVGPGTFLGSCHQLVIGADCMIGANCYLITVNHRTDHQDIPYAQQGFQGADVRLGQNVWLGSLVVVLPGVTIGDNVIVGAGAVVTRDIPEGETWAGVPARKIKK